MILLRNQTFQLGISTSMITVVVFSSALFQIKKVDAAEQPEIDPKFKEVIVDLKEFKLDESPSNHWAVVWNRTAIWIIKRTQAEIKALEESDTSRLGAPQGRYWRSQLEKMFDAHPQLPNLYELEQRQLKNKQKSC